MTKVINGWTRLEGAESTMGEHLRACGSQLWIKGDCRVIFTPREPHGNGIFRQHLSISCECRYPTWDEIHDARYSLMGLGITVAMFLPPTPQYVNIHPNCFHLYETSEKAP